MLMAKLGRSLAACREELVLHPGRAICKNYSWEGEKPKPKNFEIIEIIALLRLQSDKILVGLFGVYLAWLLGVIRVDLARDCAPPVPMRKYKKLSAGFSLIRDNSDLNHMTPTWPGSRGGV
jgi:hypothetical protein